MSILPSQRVHAGFTLLEVLISVVILSIGLLGLTILQSLGLKDNQDAYLRTQATFFIYDMSDRLKANNDFWKNQVIEDPGFPNTLNAILDGAGADTADNHFFCNTDDPPGGAAVGDQPDNCTPRQMAQYDVYRWVSNLAGILPQGTGTITRETDPNDTTDANILRLRIDWVRANQALEKQGVVAMAPPFITIDVRL